LQGSGFSDFSKVRRINARHVLAGNRGANCRILRKIAKDINFRVTGIRKIRPVKLQEFFLTIFDCLIIR
jgi:hypothetical protein